jgi:HEAT repeat protein
VPGYDPLELDGAPLPVLVELMSSPEAGERSDAACAVGDRLRSRELLELEGPVREHLAGLLRDPVGTVRFEAAMALAEAQDPRATEVLIAALSSRTLRLDATRALGASGDRRAVEPLTRIMKRWLMPWADRLQAGAALCLLGDPAGAAYLKSRLASSRHAERAAALHFLGEARHPEARGILESILADITHPLRDVAARALGLLGDPGAKRALEAARHHGDQELLADIDNALAALARGRPTTPPRGA